MILIDILLFCSILFFLIYLLKIFMTNNPPKLAFFNTTEVKVIDDVVEYAESKTPESVDQIQQTIVVDVNKLSEYSKPPNKFEKEGFWYKLEPEKAYGFMLREGRSYKFFSKDKSLRYRVLSMAGMGICIVDDKDNFFWASSNKNERLWERVYNDGLGSEFSIRNDKNDFFTVWHTLEDLYYMELVDEVNVVGDENEKISPYEKRLLDIENGILSSAKVDLERTFDIKDSYVDISFLKDKEDTVVIDLALQFLITIKIIKDDFGVVKYLVKTIDGYTYTLSEGSALFFGRSLPKNPHTKNCINHIVDFKNQAVSSSHLLICVQNGELLVRDLGSTNGTKGYHYLDATSYTTAFECSSLLLSEKKKDELIDEVCKNPKLISEILSDEFFNKALFYQFMEGLFKRPEFRNIQSNFIQNLSEFSYLFPKSFVNINGKIFLFSSNVFLNFDNSRDDNSDHEVTVRDFCLGYFIENGVLKTRLFYKSFSDGVWRVSPTFFGRFDKGKHHYTQETRLVKPITDHLDKKPLVGALEFEEAVALLNDASLTGGYSREVVAYDKGEFSAIMGLKPGICFSNFSIPLENYQESIDNLRSDNPEFLPEFGVFNRNFQLVESYQLDHSILGTINVNVLEVDFKGDKIQWHFANDGAGRVWIKDVLLKTDVSSYGNSHVVIDSGFLTTKVLEYESQAEVLIQAGYCLAVKNSDYVDISKFLDTLDIIRDYRKFAYVFRKDQADDPIGDRTTAINLEDLNR